MRISCVIPAYNEAARIGAVLDAVADHPLLAEVIVVDDRSSDDTAEQATRSGVRVMRLAKNRGKSWAVAEGIAASTGSHLLLLDADLAGLRPQDVTALVEPVRARRSDVAISLRRNSPFVWRAIGLDYISGERVFPRTLLDGRLDQLRTLPHFGLEVWLNQLWIADRMRIGVVRWPDVSSPWKTAKMGFWRGLRADAGMMGDIFRTISLPEALGQIRALRRMRVKPD